MIRGYTRPQLLIKQVLATLPNTQTRTLNAFVVGPQFDLFRYTNADERAAMKGVAFIENTNTDPTAQQLVPYEGLTPSLHVVDEAFAKLYGENLEGQYWLQPSAVQNTDASHYQFKLVSLDTPNKIQVHRRGAVVQAVTDGSVIISAAVVFAGSGYPPSTTIDLPVVGGAGSGAFVRLTINSGGAVASVAVVAGGTGYTGNVVFTCPQSVLGSNVGIKNTATGDDMNGDGITDFPLIPELHGRPVKPGDVAYVTFNSVTTRRTIKAIERELVPSHVGTDTNKANLEFAASNLNPIRTDASSFGNTSLPFNWTIGNTGTWNGLVQGSIYNGQYAERYTITVTKAGTVGNPPSDGNIGQVKIRSASGAFSADNVVVTKPGGVHTITDSNAGGQLGGLTITLTYTGDPTFALQLGDQFSFVVVGAYNPLNLVAGGQVASVTISGGGAYTSAPTGVTFSAPPAGGIQAKASITTSGSSPTIIIATITVTEPGSGYVAPPVITIVGGAGTPATLVVNMTTAANRDLELIQSGVYTGPTNTRYKLEVVKGTNVGNVNDSFTGAVVKVSDTSGIDTIQEYTVTQGTVYPLGTYGLSFAFPAGIATPGGVGSGSTATATAHYGLDDQPLTDMTGFGTLNQIGDVLTLAGGTPLSGQAAQITVTAVDGSGLITGYFVSRPGEYSAVPNAPATMSFNNLHTGSVATIAPSWHIVRVVVTAPGSAYVAVPSVVINDSGFPPETNAILLPVIIAGAVQSIEVVDGGSGYAQDVTLTLSAPVLFQTGLRTGDAYYIDAVATANTGSASVVVLNGQATDVTTWTDTDVLNNVLDMDFRELFTGLVQLQGNSPPTPAWAAGNAAVGGILVKDTLAIEEFARDASFQFLPVKNSPFARLFASWRGLVPTNSASVIKLFSAEADIVTAFGKFDKDNPACYGSVIAFRGGQGKAVFASALPSNDLAGHNTIIRQAERVDGIYAIAPMTYDRTIQQAWQQHVGKASQPNFKLWRRTYVATKNPGPYVVVNVDSNGNNFECTIQHTSTGNVRLICANSTFLTSGILPGDLVRLNFVADSWGNLTYDQFVVQTVVEEDEIILVTGPSAPISPAVRFEIWRPDTGASQASFIGARSNSFLDRRVINVWCDSPLQVDANGVQQVQELYYLAAEIAGLRSAVLPQQGLTYTELAQSVTSAPLMFTKYAEEDLDVAGSFGTYIVTQDVDNGAVYIRHQLTTDAVDALGPLFWEDSVGTNLDNIAYTVKDAFQPYIGKRNANPETLEELETKMRDLLNTFKANPGGFSAIGPALADWGGLSVQIDPVFKDRINIIVTLQLPLPINTITVTLQATTIADQTFIQFVAQTLAAAA